MRQFIHFRVFILNKKDSTNGNRESQSSFRLTAQKKDHLFDLFLYSLGFKHRPPEAKQADSLKGHLSQALAKRYPSGTLVADWLPVDDPGLGSAERWLSVTRLELTYVVDY